MENAAAEGRPSRGKRHLKGGERTPLMSLGRLGTRQGEELVQGTNFTVMNANGEVG